MQEIISAFSHSQKIREESLDPDIDDLANSPLAVV
jgi:hypothetical protein